MRFAPWLFYLSACGCLLSAGLAFKSGATQGTLIFAAIALLNVGLLIKAVRS